VGGEEQKNNRPPNIFFVLDLHMGWIEGRREREERSEGERVGVQIPHQERKRGREGGVPSTIAR
jgi:hypothetical protein